MKQYPTEEAPLIEESSHRLDSVRRMLCLVMAFWSLCMLPLMSHAGGLGIAAIAFFTGIAGYLTMRPSSVLRIPVWFWALVVFLIWANITAIWSPYSDDNTLSNPVKIGIGSVLFLGCIHVFNISVQKHRKLLAHLLIAMMTLSMGLLIIDLLSGYSLTNLVDPIKPDENPFKKNHSSEMNLGHAVTVLVLFLPVTMMLIYRYLSLGWIVAVVFAFMVVVTALFAKLAIGILGALGVLAAMFMARLRPGLTIRALTWVAIFSILLSPLVGYLMGFISDDMKAAIPFSWEHRILMWHHVAERILEHPVIGHGFDATRTFDATFSSRGVESWAVVSLHPHNAGLHIWAETGLVGVALASVAILMIGIATEHYVKGDKLRTMAAAGILAAAIIIGNVTYGVWQDWWWASIILVCACMRLLPSVERSSE